MFRDSKKASATSIKRDYMFHHVRACLVSNYHTMPLVPLVYKVQVVAGEYEIEAAAAYDRMFSPVSDVMQAPRANLFTNANPDVTFPLAIIRMRSRTSYPTNAL